MDAEKRKEIIANLMQKIPERKPKHDEIAQPGENAQIRHGENEKIDEFAKICENDTAGLCENNPRE